MACCMAMAASRPAEPAIDESPMGSSAEHQPPLRPLAPKPATSASTSVTRSDGSSRRR